MKPIKSHSFALKSFFDWARYSQSFTRALITSLCLGDSRSSSWAGAQARGWRHKRSPGLAVSPWILAGNDPGVRRVLDLPRRGTRSDRETRRDDGPGRLHVPTHQQVQCSHAARRSRFFHGKVSFCCFCLNAVSSAVVHATGFFELAYFLGAKELSQTILLFKTSSYPHHHHQYAFWRNKWSQNSTFNKAIQTAVCGSYYKIPLTLTWTFSRIINR